MIPFNSRHPSWPKIQNQILWAPLRMLEADHHLLLAEIQKLQGIFQKWRGQSPDTWAVPEKKQVQSWFREHRLHLGGHFEAEETAVFPYLIQQIPRLAPVLAKLQHEHLEIRRQSMAVEAAYHGLCNPARDGQKDGSFCRNALALLLLIKRHVTQEQQLIANASSR